jgi:hypothetical protein
LENATKGGFGVDKNLNQACEWYLKSAVQNNATAQFKLGIFYENGQEVKQNYETAFKWYKKAIYGGHLEAQNDYSRACLKFFKNKIKNGKLRYDNIIERYEFEALIFVLQQNYPIFSSPRLSWKN